VELALRLLAPSSVEKEEIQMTVDESLEAFRAEAARLRAEGSGHLAYLLEHDIWLIEMARKAKPPDGRPLLCYASDDEADV
jgi:hypothetical protein